MPLGTQSRLLRVLEYGEFIKVGSSKVLKTDVRVVAATNVNLIEAVQKGKFREDLYYRLSSVPIFVPPLRDRGRDIELIFRKFATDFADRHRVKPISLTPEAEQVLLSYRFPGNIRELKNIVEQMSLLVEDREIDAATLRGFLPSMSTLPALYQDANNQGGDSNAGYSERDLLYKVLFEMRRDMTELKKLVYRILQADGVSNGARNGRNYSPPGGPPSSSGSPNGVSSNRPAAGYPDQDYARPGYGDELIREHEHLFNFNDMEQEESSAELAENLARQRLYYAKSAPPETQDTNDTYDVIEDITHETEDDGDLSLEKKEKELIIKALRKNDSKRKYAANDLGISETNPCTEKLSSMRLSRIGVDSRRSIADGPQSIVNSRQLTGNNREATVDCGLSTVDCRLSTIGCWLLPLVLLTFQSCGVYTFTGAAISPEVKTISIQNFYNDSGGGPPVMSQQFTENVKRLLPAEYEPYPGG